MSEEGTSEIPAPFDDMPRVENPSPSERFSATGRIPPRAVPAEGPIPDYHHIHTIEKEITVPAWALEAVRYRLEHADTDDLERSRAEELLAEYAYIHERFVTADGDDAVSMLLNELGGSAAGGEDDA